MIARYILIQTLEDASKHPGKQFEPFRKPLHKVVRKTLIFMQRSNIEG